MAYISEIIRMWSGPRRIARCGDGRRRCRIGTMKKFEKTITNDVASI